MNRCPIRNIALLAQPLNRDANGNPRYFIPEKLIPVALGSALARKVGLQKFRGKGRGPGFVIQSYHIDTTLHEIFAALDHYAPKDAPHAVRSDGPLFFAIRLPDEQYQHLSDAIESLAPHLMERTEFFTKVVIPSGLSSADRTVAENILMDFPFLRTATLGQLSRQRVAQHYGLEILVLPHEDAKVATGDLTNPVRDRELISSFLARKEPPAR